jgi:hypothetical protein
VHQSLLNSIFFISWFPTLFVTFPHSAHAYVSITIYQPIGHYHFVKTTRVSVRQFYICFHLLTKMMFDTWNFTAYAGIPNLSSTYVQPLYIRADFLLYSTSKSDVRTSPSAIFYCRDISCPDWRFHGFHQSLHADATAASFRTSPNYRPSIVDPIRGDVVYLPKASLDNLQFNK